MQDFERSTIARLNSDGRKTAEQNCSLPGPRWSETNSMQWSKAAPAAGLAQAKLAARRRLYRFERSSKLVSRCILTSHGKRLLGEFA